MPVKRSSIPSITGGDVTPFCRHEDLFVSGKSEIVSPAMFLLALNLECCTSREEDGLVALRYYFASFVSCCKCLGLLFLFVSLEGYDLQLRHLIDIF